LTGFPSFKHVILTLLKDAPSLGQETKH